MSLGRGIFMGTVGAASLLAITGAASATTLSFASDDDSNFSTFMGSSGSGGMFMIRNGRTPLPTPVTLNVDDNNGANPTAQLPVGLVVSLSATHVASTPFGGEWNHVYAVSGSYSFVHPVSSAPLLVVQINPGSAAMTIVGGATTWGSAGSIIGSDAAAGVPNGVDYSDVGLSAYMTSLGYNPNNYIVSGGTFFAEDFAFTLTSLNADGGIVELDAGHLPTTSWFAEGSHSGHAFDIPAPGAAAAAGVFMMTLGTRRRRKSAVS
ncbi:MAG: hypothetical protein ACK4WH_11705 [Phycisphaerales bacterium]